MRTIFRNENYRLVAPHNHWDMNYHLFEKSSDKEYLIDIEDIPDGYVLSEHDIYGIKSLAWKVLVPAMEVF